MYKSLLFLLVPFFYLWSSGQVYRSSISVHDPVMIRQDSSYYIFCTGRGISVWSSKDRKEWKAEPPVFSTPPQWAVEAVPGFRGHIWAPDISYHDGLYYLYYSVSLFGKNTSCIGVATNRTLNAADPAFKWTDHGKVIQSYPGKTHWNAIDPNLAEDVKGTPYLAFGSFWDGIKLVKLTADRLSLAEDSMAIRTIASRKESPSDKGDNAIEAPFIFKKKGYYYLFASVDYCCKGENSTYKMIAGRSKSIEGPYVDKEGREMQKGGGTIVLQGDKAWYGVGHNAVCTFDGDDYLIFHGYDAADKARPKLRIEKLAWVDGFPVVRTSGQEEAR